MAYVYKENRELENVILDPDSRSQAVEDIWDYLKPGNHRRKLHGIGQIVYKNRYQYIKDKLIMLEDEFLCKIYKPDVEFLIYKCPTIADIDCYCRKIFYREWSDVKEV